MYCYSTLINSPCTQTSFDPAIMYMTDEIITYHTIHTIQTRHVLEVWISRQSDLHYIPMHDLSLLVYLHILESCTFELSHGDIIVLISSNVWDLITRCITGRHLLAFLDFSSSASQDFWQLFMAKNKIVIHKKDSVKMPIYYAAINIEYTLWNSIIRLQNNSVIFSHC